MSLKWPNPGGESCKAHSHERQMSAKADHARRSKSVLLGRKWNCEGVRSTLLLLKNPGISDRIECIKKDTIYTIERGEGKA